jgi:signal transduction histidine kinase
MAVHPIIEVLGEFGAGYGQTENLVVRFLLAAFFWAVLAGTALRQARREGQRRDRWVAAAALLGLSRELWMFVMEYGAKRHALPHELTHALYPPLEHLLTQFSYLCAGAAFANYFGASRQLVRRYLTLNSALILGVYAAVQVTWPRFLATHPGAVFGEFPPDLWLHVFMAWLLAPVVAGLLFARRRGRRVPVTLVAGFSLFLLDDLLMIVHLGLGGIRPEVFAPLRHNLHLWAVPLFIAVYWGELTRRLEDEREKTLAIVAAIGDGISIHAPDLRVTYQNQVHRDMVGDQVGQFCYRAYRHRETVCEDCAVQMAMTDGRVHSEERVYPRSGKVLSVTASPLRDADGTVVGGIEVVRDLTEQRVLEQRTTEAQKLEAVGRLAGGVAHDFNNLLTVILGRTELLQAGANQPEATRRGLAEIHRVSERAAALTRQLLAFSRRQPHQSLEVDLNRVLEDTESILRRLIPENIRIDIEPATALEPVTADPAQLEQVVVNLAVNARDAMPEGGSLRIATGHEDVPRTRPGRHGPLPAGRYVVLTVADSGEGMGEDVLRHLFEPFFTTKEVGQGTGLGLATVFGIVEQSRGHIEVESAPSRGATFRVYLPRSAGGGAPEVIPPSAPPRARGAETVLLVEDEDDVRRLTAGILEDAGYTVLATGREREARARLAAHDGSVHLLLTDVILPGASGPELARELVARHPGMRVLFMSGYTHDELTRSGADPDEIELLTKPFTPLGLLGRVRQVLDPSRAA